MNAVAEGLTVGKCSQCGALYFPRRLICRRCGSDAWVDARVTEAVIEEVTTLNQAIGQAPGARRHLATARTIEGLHLIVGLEIRLEPGVEVNLVEKGGAPFARETKPRCAGS
jgi:uncharacterized OB-fold protein